jgi:carbon monoxide dehydrogenase subunit G
LHGTIEIHLQIVERKEQSRAVYHGWGTGPGSHLTLDAAFDVSDAQGGGTDVVWSGSAAIEGPVASVADTLFRPLSSRNFEHLQRELDEPRS